MSKRKKFDLTALVNDGYIKEGETLYFVSDPKRTCTVTKMPNHEFKVVEPDGKPTTIHAFAQVCLGTEPPNHAAVWIRNATRKTLYDFWNASFEDAAA